MPLMLGLAVTHTQTSRLRCSTRRSRHVTSQHASGRVDNHAEAGMLREGGEKVGVRTARLPMTRSRRSFQDHCWYDEMVTWEEPGPRACASCTWPRGRYSTSPGCSVTSSAGGGSAPRGMSDELAGGSSCPGSAPYTVHRFLPALGGSRVFKEGCVCSVCCEMRG